MCTPYSFSPKIEINTLDKKFENFVKIFKQLRINIPFVDATKFLKEFMFRKRGIEDHETIALAQKCGKFLYFSIFTISYSGGEIQFLLFLTPVTKMKPSQIICY